VLGQSLVPNSAVRDPQKSDMKHESLSKIIVCGITQFRTHMSINSLANASAVISVSLAAFHRTLSVSGSRIVIVQS